MERAVHPRLGRAIACLALAALASCRVDTLFPLSLATSKGTDGGQPVSVLSMLDESGSTSTSGAYMSFYPASNGYKGIFTFQAPSGLDSSTVGTIGIAVNYRGDAVSTQRWTFELYDTTTQTWTVIGDNTGATTGVWIMLELSVSTNASHYVASDGTIQLRYATTGTPNSSKLDYVAMTLSSAPPDSNGISTAFSGSYDYNNPNEVAYVADHPLQVTGVGPDKLAALREANPSLSALYYIKIAGVHGPDTVPPNGDPQWAGVVSQNLLWKGASGAYVTSGNNGWYYVNVQDPNKRAKWWTLQRAVLDQYMTYYDGIYFDNTHTINADFTDIVSEEPSGYDDTQYYAALASLLASARSAYPGKKIVFNTYAGWENPGYRGIELLSSADGLFFEGFSAKTLPGFFTKPRLLQQIADFQTIVRSGKQAVAMDYSSGSDIALRTFTLGCYLMVLDPNSLRLLTDPDLDTDVQQWPENSLDLGAPLGDYYTNGAGLLERDFAGGRAIVNPEDSVTRTYTVDPAAAKKLVVSGGGAWPATGSLDWQPVSGTLSMAPMTGLVLQNTPH